MSNLSIEEMGRMIRVPNGKMLIYMYSLVCVWTHSTIQQSLVRHPQHTKSELQVDTSSEQVWTQISPKSQNSSDYNCLYTQTKPSAKETNMENRRGRNKFLPSNDMWNIILWLCSSCIYSVMHKLVQMFYTCRSTYIKIQSWKLRKKATGNIQKELFPSPSPKFHSKLPSP